MCAACIERNISSHCFSICQFAYLLFPSVSVCPCVSLSNSVWLSFYINLSLYFSFFLVAQLFDSLTVCRSIGPLVHFMSGASGDLSPYRIYYALSDKQICCFPYNWRWSVPLPILPWKKKHFCVCGAKVSISEIYQSFSDCHGDLLFTNKVTRLVIDAKRFFTIWESLHDKPQ